MDYPLIWFFLIGLLWTGYLVLEGFDFGVGALLPVLGRGNDEADTAKRRRLMLTTIGPHWDGNEVWLLTAGGAMFAAFPYWYATTFSALYLPFFLLLVALIVRNMGLEYRYKRADAKWQRGWDAAIIGGSLAAPLLVGTALTNLVRGLPLDENSDYVGSFWTILNPVSLLGGVTVVALSLLLGAIFTSLKTRGQLSEDARTLALSIGGVAALLAVIFLGVMGVGHGKTASWVASGIAAVSLLAALALVRAGRTGWAFVAATATIAAAVAALFIMLSPNVLPTTLPGGRSLTIENAASTELTLKIMTGAALVFTPIMGIYTAVSYWVFRRRLSTDDLPRASVGAH